MYEVIKDVPEAEMATIEAARRIGCAALDTIDLVYGSGYPAWESGFIDLAYHNGRHARSVAKATVQMAAALDLSPSATAIGEAAALAHDENQLDGRGVDEERSAQWLEAQMRAYKHVFTPLQIEIGKLGIKGTEPIFDENMRIIGQRADFLEYPTKEAEYVAKSVVCGDFGVLFQPDGPLSSHLLFREIQKVKSAEEPKVEDGIAFQQGQMELLDTYSYPLPEANDILATHRSEVTAYSQQVLDQLERGDITSWAQLIEQDIAFARQLA